MSETPKRVGRPRAPIDADQVFKLARLGCTNVDIAEWFGVSPATITNNHQADLTAGRAAMKISLRRAQLKRALAGGDSMLVHLGKWILGQADKAPRTYVDGALEMSHEDALAELEMTDPRPFVPPQITIQYVDAPAGSLAADAPDPFTEAAE